MGSPLFPCLSLHSLTALRPSGPLLGRNRVWETRAMPHKPTISEPEEDRGPVIELDRDGFRVRYGLLREGYVVATLSINIHRLPAIRARALAEGTLLIFAALLEEQLAS